MRHDQTLNELWIAFFAELIALLIPQEAKRLNLQSVEFLDKEQFTDFPSGEQRTVDLLARVQTLDGAPEVILFHVEVQGQPQRNFSERMLEYYMILTLRLKLPILPIAVFLYPGEGIHEWATHQREVLGNEILIFHYLKIGLPDLKAEDFLKSGSPVAYALAALMQPGEGGKAKLKVDCMEGVALSSIDEARKYLLWFVIESYLKLSPEETKEYEEMIAAPEKRRVIELKTLKDVYLRLGYEEGEDAGLERGLEQGVEQGIVQGLLQGIRRTTRRQLEKKFGPLPERAQQRLEGMGQEELNLIADALLDARSLEELGLAG